VVVIGSGEVYANAFYILVAERLLRVNHPSNFKPSFSLSQEVLIQGSWHSTPTREYLRLEEMKLLEMKDYALNPNFGTDLGLDDWGLLFEVQGELVLNQSSKLVVKTSTQEVEVRLPAGFQKPDAMRKGSQVKILGFVDVYQGRARLHPWLRDQISILEVEASELKTVAKSSESSDVAVKNANGESEYVPWEDYQLDLQTGFRQENLELFFEPLWSRLPVWLRNNKLFLVVLAINLLWWTGLGFSHFRKKILS
jgi:hypothetical protein